MVVEEALRRLIDGERGNIVTITSSDIYRLIVGGDYPPPRLAEAIYATVMAVVGDCVVREEVKRNKRGTVRHVLWLSVPCLRQILLSI